MPKTKITMEEIHGAGARRHPTRWLVANETAIHAAVRLGFNYTKLENKTLLSLVVFHVLETFFNDKSPYKAAQSPEFIKEDGVELSDKLRTLILMGCKAAGCYFPEEAMTSVEESLTATDYEVSTAFLQWVVENRKTFGHGNIDQVWAEHQASLKKVKA